MAGKSKDFKTKQEVLDIIRDKILYLELKPGEPLLDQKIAAELQVSRTPIREALLALKKERFVDIFPQSGTFVSLLDLKLIKEIVHIRHVLECDIFQHLLESHVEIESRLDRYIVLQELAVKEQNQREYVKNDHLFHREIFRAGGHIQSWDLIEGMYNHTTRFHMLDFYNTYVFGTSLEEHKLLLESYHTGDKDGVMRILELHHDCDLRTSNTLVKEFPDYFLDTSAV